MADATQCLTVLAGDIGGTKTLLALYALCGPRLELLRSERYPSAEWPDLAPMVQAFLGSDSPPAAACFAVAGPVQGGEAHLTNLPWQLSEAELSRDTGIERVNLVNDFAVLVYGLPHLEPHQQAPVVAGQAVAAEPLLVLGAGTGLGVAIGLPARDGAELTALASEAAHGEFAPRSAQEWALKQWLLASLDLERLSIERVVSGTGLGHVTRWLLDSQDPGGAHPLQSLAATQPDELPAATTAAAAEGDPLATAALEVWLGAYGSVCGDLALTSLSRGGIWLAGGTAAKLLEPLRGNTFREAFLAKGRLGRVLANMPITAVLDPAIGQFSAACRARMLLG
ncbi:glucokinase [Cyanobium sp. LEGE 06113]|uniref:glucokinase n=1 Tax=Cyanobium sp. LEGE 06113 TaxID=1297573 RepID=UPI00188244DA|nr:glucokinase [Cyanobium sp. LEGE 06113]MBE9154947.1 glucokinase [Cyanobium sp. LEGE 06113]